MSWNAYFWLRSQYNVVGTDCLEPRAWGSRGPWVKKTWDCHWREAFSVGSEPCKNTTSFWEFGVYRRLYFRFTPHPVTSVTVTTRLMTILAGNPELNLYLPLQSCVGASRPKLYCDINLPIEPEHDGLEDDFPLPRVCSQVPVPAANLPRCTHLKFNIAPEKLPSQ